MSRRNLGFLYGQVLDQELAEDGFHLLRHVGRTGFSDQVAGFHVGVEIGHAGRAVLGVLELGRNVSKGHRR